MPEASKRAVIVGGSRGLGRGAVEEHLRRGWAVTATVRKSEALADINSDKLTVAMLDTTDWSAIDAVGESLGEPIDRLFVIAGDTGPDGPIGDVDPDAFSRVMAVNTLAPLRIIDRWSSRMAPDGMLVVMSSYLGSLVLNDAGGWEAYRISKAGVNMGLKSIAARHTGDLTYVAINPGWVKTALGGENADMTVEESIPQVLDALDEYTGRGGVHFANYSKNTLPW